MAPESYEDLVWKTAVDISRSLEMPLGDCLISVITQTSRGLPFSQTEMVGLAKSVRNRAFHEFQRGKNVDRFIAFLRRLIKDAKQKIFLIVDNLQVHHAKKVMAWVESHAHEIELFYLPSYAPDHNPDDFLNGDLKQKLRQKPQSCSKDSLVKATRAVMRRIQRSHRRIKSYFMAEPVKYAA